MQVSRIEGYRDVSIPSLSFRRKPESSGFNYPFPPCGNDNKGGIGSGKLRAVRQQAGLRIFSLNRINLNNTLIVIPAYARMSYINHWIPTFAGMT